MDLLFISTRFLYPIDSGGKIRTTQILRGLLNGKFKITLISPATAEEVTRWNGELNSICDDFVYWKSPKRGKLFNYTRIRHLLNKLPIPIRTDLQRNAVKKIEELLHLKKFDLIVVDFLHASVLLSDEHPTPKVLFTHNVESEIFARHIEHAKNMVMRIIWQNQFKKMYQYERAELQRYQKVVAVSDRDKHHFENKMGARSVQTIPTGVDLDFFSYSPPIVKELIFIGSMDWLPNQDAIRHFGDEVWPLLLEKHPKLKLLIIGRAPPDELVNRARMKGYNWEFTGYVDDIRPYAKSKAISILPIRIGGGTRLKAYESMAMGTVMVSTSIGIEGLPIEDRNHYVNADTAVEQAEAIDALINDDQLRLEISRKARDFVEQHFSFHVAAHVFEQICLNAVSKS